MWIIIGVVLLLGFCCVSVGAGTLCFGVASFVEPGDLEYRAHGGSCRLDVIYLDGSGKEVRHGRVRGPFSDGTYEPWSTDATLGTGDRFMISVIPAESCMREPTCEVRYRGEILVPLTIATPHPDGSYAARCEGVVP